MINQILLMVGVACVVSLLNFAWEWINNEENFKYEEDE